MYLNALSTKPQQYVNLNVLRWVLAGFSLLWKQPEMQRNGTCSADSIGFKPVVAAEYT